ncbi:hypothetical protein BH10PSE3_BH10PSE3_21950 [soil metagenome]
MSAIEPGTASSDLVGRAKRLLLSPSSEWDRIDAEPATIKGIYVGYVCILAAIPPIAGLIGGQVFGHGGFGFHFKPALVPSIIGAVVAYGLSLLSVFLIALIIDALAPSFDGQKDRLQAFKVSAYSYTAAWVFGVLGIFPPLALIAGLASLYGLYLLYLGLPKLMKAPKEKAVGYTVVTILCAIVLSIVIGAITGAVAGAALFGAASHVADTGRAAGTVEYNGTKIDMGKLDAANKKMEAAAARMEAGKNAPSVPAETLKALLPANVAGFARTSVESNSGAAGGMSIATATGEYQKDSANFRLAVTDLGPMAAMATLASAVNAESTKETAHGYERTGTVDGRLTTEEWDRETKYGRYNVVVGERFSVEANGSADSIDVLKQAVGSVDAGRLEALAR